MFLCDSHTHLDQYPPDELPQILERADSAQVDFILCAGTSVASSRACIALAEGNEAIHAGVGIHPMDVKGPVDEATYDALKGLALGSDKVVCISEIGLDFLPESPDRATQYQAFREQIRLARELRLPVIFHSRESHPEVLRVLREERAGDVGAVMHYFQADEATAREALELGVYISLARPLLRLPELQALASELPMERLVLETDAYPQPFKKHRHSWTEPRHVREVAGKLAELRGMELEEVAKVTTRNLMGLLGRAAAPDRRGGASKT